MVPWHLRRGVDSEIMTVMFRAFIIIHRGLEVFQWFFVDFCWSIWVPSKEPTGGKPHVFLVSLLLNLISPRACYQLEKTSGQRNKVLSSIRRQEVCKTKVDDELGDGPWVWRPLDLVLWYKKKTIPFTKCHQNWQALILPYWHSYLLQELWKLGLQHYSCEKPHRPSHRNLERGVSSPKGPSRSEYPQETSG